MRKKKYNSEEIIRLLRQSEVILARGDSVGMMCKELGMSDATYYKWRREYGGMRVSQAKRLKELELENGRLKRAVADLALSNLILKEVAEGN
jgi:transposase-like protein